MIFSYLLLILLSTTTAAGRPHKLNLERQQQLRSQRRHEENVRQDYYQRTARYFEREAVLTKQFSSWTTKAADSYNERIEKKHKEEQLQERREKLKRLLEEEEKSYRLELEEQKKSRRNRRRTEEILSLEDLKQRLIEKRAEESLYYPSSCRRSMSCAASLAEIDRCMKLIDLSDGKSSRPGSGDSRKQTRFSTNLLSDEPSMQSKPVNNTENLEISNQRSVTPKSLNSSLSSYQTNLRFAARRSGLPSLSNTNIRGDGASNDQYDTSSRYSKDRVECSSEKSQNGLKKTNDDEAIALMADTAVQKNSNTIEECRSATGTPKSASALSEMLREDLQCDPYEFEKFEYELNEASNRHPERNQLSIANPIGDPNLNFKNKTERSGDEKSMQHYRYLKHIELKAKILDLCKREHVYVTKQSWDEALRLREMRNKLILLKNKNLYDNHDLDIDEEIRESALKVIEAREAVHNKREKMCNSMLYSDEAKDLWKRWVQEDDNLSKIDTTNATRDLFFKKIEEDWKNLAMRDKQRISELYDTVMNHSELQDELKLAAAFREANERQKKYSCYFEK